jgi:putative two-component system response regulator
MTDSMSRIIIVDDDEATLKLYCAIIRRELGEEPHAYADPRAALAALPQLDAALVIVDYYMPDVDGIAFTQALRSLPAYTTTPVLMFTASGDRKVGRRALAAGATTVVPKPFRVEQFRALLAQHAPR